MDFNFACIESFDSVGYVQSDLVLGDEMELNFYNILIKLATLNIILIIISSSCMEFHYGTICHMKQSNYILYKLL
jgi:hypothetical protein